MVLRILWWTDYIWRHLVSSKCWTITWIFTKWGDSRRGDTRWRETGSRISRTGVRTQMISITAPCPPLLDPPQSSGLANPRPVRHIQWLFFLFELFAACDKVLDASFLVFIDDILLSQYRCRYASHEKPSLAISWPASSYPGFHVLVAIFKRNFSL